MTTPSHRAIRWLAAICLATWCASAQGAITVYDLKVDFSDVNNPMGTWELLSGNTPLTHYTPVPTSLSTATANGYWGTSSTSLNTSVMKATGNGSTAAGHSDNDFLAGDVLVRTTDPSTGGPVIVAWTAPSNGFYTYVGDIWNADPGPFSNTFSITLNNGPVIESGSTGFSNDRNNPVGTLNGTFPTNVLAGDVLRLEITPTAPAPFGTLAGLNIVIDFQAVPEPSSAVLIAAGAAALAGFGWRRSRAR